MAAVNPEILAVKTRNPSEMSFRVPFPLSMLRPNSMPVLYTAYKDCRILANAGAILDGLGDYTYGFNQEDGNLMWFYFVKPKTDDERKIPFNTFNTSVKERWPNVLNDIIFQVDNAFPLATSYPLPRTLTDTGGMATAFAPNLIERLNITPETLALCLVRVDQFTSNLPWGANDLTHLQPTEGVVSWDFNGAKGSLTCLHGDIKIPARGKAYTTVVDGTTTSSEPAPFVPERIFPATNMEAWQSYILYDDVKWEEGVYFRERATIFPPEENEPNLV